MAARRWIDFISLETVIMTTNKYGALTLSHGVHSAWCIYEFIIAYPYETPVMCEVL